MQGAVPTTSQLDLGELAINTYDGRMYLKRNNGTESIVEIGKNVIISNTAPSNASNADLWWDSEEGKLKIYYDDGDSGQWVDAVSNIYNSSVPEGSLYVRYDAIQPTVDCLWVSPTGQVVLITGS